MILLTSIYLNQNQRLFLDIIKFFHRMNIVFFTPYFSMWNTFMTENLLIEQLSENNNITVLYCRNFMNNICIAHDAEHKSIFSAKKDKLKICNICNANFNEISQNSLIKFICIDDYISSDVNKIISEFNFNSKSNNELLEFEINNIKIGKMALYESSLRKKKIHPNINDNEEKQEIIDKIQQIIKFNNSLASIYKNLAPDFAVTTNGFYYITNFFLKFNESKKVNTISLFNSLNYRFARSDLRICYQNEFIDKSLLSSNFKIYNKLPLYKSSLSQALLNVESQIKKEHSHSFAPKYLKDVDIRKKFNIKKEKKIILVILSSQAEIFSAKYVLSKEFEKGIFNSQLDFLKFILEKSKELDDFHFIIRTHPRQYIGNIADEIIQMNELNLDEYKNISINTPEDGLSPFNFIKDIEFVINSWSSLAIDFGVFGLENITIFPEFSLYPKECMNILDSKEHLVTKIFEIKKRNINRSIISLKYLQAENMLAVVNFRKNFFLSKSFFSFFNNILDKFLFRFFYIRIWRFIKNISVNNVDKLALKYFFNKNYVTYHESKFYAIQENKSKSSSIEINDYALVKTEINKFTKKNFNYSNFI